MSQLTQIEPEWIIPVEPSSQVLTGHAVIIGEQRIVDVLDCETAKLRYPSATRLALPEHALIPGLINVHSQMGTTMLRGLSAKHTSPPAHLEQLTAQHLSESLVYDSALLACAEMLHGGITTCSDSYYFPEASARAALQCGMRLRLGVLVQATHSAYANDSQDYLARGMHLRDQLRDEPLLSFALALLAPQALSAASLAEIATYAHELDLPIQAVLHETPEVIQLSLDAHGERPWARLAAAGLCDPGLVTIHGVHLTEAEIFSMARCGASVVYCPSANLLLRRGDAPVATLHSAGVPIALGSDSAAFTQHLDLWQEMRLAALLNASTTPSLAAQRALESATLGGARALGQEANLGSIHAGKYADLVAVDLSDSGSTPCYDPIHQLIYGGGRERVRAVWVNGRQRLANGALIEIDELAIRARTKQWQHKVQPLRFNPNNSI